MDDIDKQILAILSKNSRLTNKEIGQTIHMTGQAVGNRILNLQNKEIIKSFSININYQQTQFIKVYMDTNKFKEFERTMNTFLEVEAIFKTSGQACYMIISHFNEGDLADFIETLSKWARYSVETVISDRTVDKDALWK